MEHLNEMLEVDGKLYVGKPETDSCAGCDFDEIQNCDDFFNDDNRCLLHQLVWVKFPEVTINGIQKGHKTTLEHNETFDTGDHTRLDYVCQCGKPFAESLMEIGTNNNIVNCASCGKYCAEIVQAETFPKEEIKEAIKKFIEYGEQTFSKMPGLSHEGNFSGDGWAARRLRQHLEDM